MSMVHMNPLQEQFDQPLGRDVSMADQALIQQLQRRIERIETTSRADDGNTFSSGSPIIDRMLPAGGYRRGTLVEWIAAPAKSRRASGSSGGCAADFLSMLAAVSACADGGALVVADCNRQFYPPAAAALGIDPGNMVVIRPGKGGTGFQPVCAQSQAGSLCHRSSEEFFWAIDQSLRCPAVAAVWVAAARIGERWFRRFQLAAESSGTVGLFVRPPSALGQPGWSEVQWKVQPTSYQSTPSLREGRRFTAGEGDHPPTLQATKGPASRAIRLQLLRCRGGKSGSVVNLRIDSASGGVSMDSIAIANKKEKFTLMQVG